MMSESTDKGLETVKKPLYATVGATDAAVQAVADVVAKVRERAENTRTEVSGRYADLAQRGEGAVHRLRTRPGVEQRLERTEEVLGKVSVRTRAVGERAAKLAGRATGSAEAAADKVDDATVAVAKKAPAKKAPANKAPAKKMTS